MDEVLNDHAKLGVNQLPVVSPHTHKSVSLQPVAFAASGQLSPLQCDVCSSTFRSHVNAKQHLHCNSVEHLYNGIAAQYSGDVLVEALRQGCC